MSLSASYLIAIAVMVALDNVTSQSMLTCYSCLKSYTSLNNYTNTCPESFPQTGANTCQGRACLMIISEYEGDGGSALNVGCPANELDQLLARFQGQGTLSVSSCDILNLLRRGMEFYKFDGMCCTTQQKRQQSLAYNETICGCDSDYCNRNLTSFQLKSAPTTESQVIATTASSQGSICQQGLIASMVSLTAVMFL